MKDLIKDLSGLNRIERNEAIKAEMNIEVVKVLTQKGIESSKELFNLSGRGFDAVAKVKFAWMCENGYDFDERNKTVINTNNNNNVVFSY